MSIFAETVDVDLFQMTVAARKGGKASGSFLTKDTVRTFVAVETSASVRQRAAELIRIFAATGARVSWVQPQNLHLTLKFLDEVPLNSIPAGKRRRAEDDRRVRAVRTGDLPAGAFPSAGRPRTLWLGTGQGSEPLGNLHAALESALKPIGFPKEHRRFAAHLTIGRVRGPGPGLGELGPLIKQHADFTAGQFPVAELVVFSSQLTPKDPIYEALSRAASKVWLTRRNTGRINLRMSDSPCLGLRAANRTILGLPLDGRWLFIALSAPQLPLQSRTIQNLPQPPHRFLSGFPLAQDNFDHNFSYISFKKQQRRQQQVASTEHILTISPRVDMSRASKSILRNMQPGNICLFCHVTP